MVINLTAHEINVYDEGGRTVLRTYPPFGVAARVTYSARDAGTLDGIPLTEALFGDVENLPNPMHGVTFIISSFVASAVQGVRDDCVVPDRQIRDDRGRVIGCRAFRKV